MHRHCFLSMKNITTNCAAPMHHSLLVPIPTALNVPEMLRSDFLWNDDARIPR